MKEPKMSEDEYAIYSAINHADDEWTPEATKVLNRIKAAAWDNGVDTAGQYAEQPWIVDEECKPLNPYRQEEG